MKGASDAQWYLYFPGLEPAINNGKTGTRWFGQFIMIVRRTSHLSGRLKSVQHKGDPCARVQWWMFVMAGLLSIIIALVTVSYQAIKAALVNPVKSLRSE